jgi:hypothetical protein
MSIRPVRGVLLAGTHTLRDGSHVRLRIARPGDEPRIAKLLARVGVAATDLEVVRLLRFDPRVRVVVCATALIGAAETAVGLAAVDLASGASTPDTLVVDRCAGVGLDELLISATLAHVANLAASTAA